MTTTPDDVLEPMRAALAALDHRRDTILASGPAIRAGLALKAQFPGLIYDHCGVTPMEIGIGCWVEVYVTDAAQVAAMRRACVALGYHLERHSEYPEERRQTFGMLHESGQALTLNVHFPADDVANVTCRYVQTGTKVVPVFELRCAESAAT